MASVSTMVRFLVAGSLLSGVAGAAAGAVPEASTADGETTVVLLEESFEEVFPELPWRVKHPPDAADVDWGRTSHRASVDRHSIYCAGMGPDAPAAGGPAPADTISWAIVGPFDLSETTSGILTFDLWMRTEQYHDVLMWLVSTDGETFSGSARSTSTDGWLSLSADLANWGAAGNVIGEPEVWVAFVYQSDHSNLFEGAYLDNVKLVVDLGAPGDEGRTYTTDADFEEGTMVGMVTDSNNLVLTDGWDTLPYVWMPNSVTGTISKIDAESGGELGRYWTGPTDEVDPGGVAVDLEGSCWVGNRGAGTVVKIGLVENGGCVDRDEDGEIETSTDRNDDGDISGSELLDWGEDECVLVETVLVKGFEGIHEPGDGHEDYDANDLQALAVDANGDVWVGVYQSNMLYHLDGDSGGVLTQLDVADENTYPTSAVVDADGTVWFSSWSDQWVLGVIPESREVIRVDLDHGSSGVAVDRNDGLFVTGLEHRAFSKVDTAAGEVVWRQPADWLANGVATTESGRVWVAAAGDGTVTRFSPQGQFPRWTTLSGGPTGLAVDQDGKVWVAGAETDVVYRVDPQTVLTDLEKTLVGSGGHNATGDFTGIVARNLTSRYGSWTAIHDNQVAGTPWGQVAWKAKKPEGTFIRVRVCSSEDQETWSPWESAAKGADLVSTPPGRYIQIQASLQLVSGDELPKLKELTVTPTIIEPIPEADFTWTPSSPAAGQLVVFQDTSTGEPTSWSWDFGDGSTSTVQNPDHTFTTQTSFDVRLTATNDNGSDTANRTVEVGAATGCVLTCAAVVPATADLNETVSFEGVVDAEGCAGGIDYAWVFGDGATSDQPNPTHAYGAVGTLRWRMAASGDGANCSSAGDITISGAGPDSCDLSYWVPVVSRADGAGGSVWRSDLGLLGSESSGASVELRFHGGGTPATRVVTVSSGAMVNLVDVVDWIDPGFSGSGALEICSDGELVVDSRTYNVLASDHGCFPGGTFGQHLAGEIAGAGVAMGATARLGQLRESSAFRTNIGLVNTGSEDATVAIALFDATGAELTTFEVGIAAGRWHQENRPFSNRAGREDLDAASATVSVIAGNGVVAYASVVDNLTNDATTVPMR